MYTDSTHVEVLSRRPLWYYDDEPICFENTYSNEEVVRVYKADGNTYDIPIRGNSVSITDIGVILYRSQEDAIRFRDIEGNVEMLSSIIKNQFNTSMRSDYVKKIKGYSIDFESGLYSVSDFDDYLYSNSVLSELRYLNKDDYTRKIKPVVSESLIKAINDYMIVHDISNYDITNSKVIFDVYVENGNIYIDSFKIDYCNNTPGPLLWSPINNFPLFTSKFEALAYKYEMNHTDESSRAAMTLLRKQHSKQRMLQKQVVDSKIVDAVDTGTDFVMNTLKLGEKITGGVDKACNKLKSGEFKRSSKLPTPKLRNLNKDIRTCDESEIFVAF